MQDIQKFEAEVKTSKWDGKGKKFSHLLDAYKIEASNPHKFNLDFSKWLPELGRFVAPVVPGEMLCILSDTGSGKTVMLQQIVTKIAPPLKTLFFEMELPDNEMLKRFVAMKKMTPTRHVEGLVQSGDADDIVDLMEHFTLYSEAKFTVDDMEEIIDIEKPQIVIVDYIGLVRNLGKSRYEKLSDIAEELKLLATTKKVILIVSCQVARNKNAETGELFLHDAKDSGSIENSAQRMLGLWREGDKGEDFKIKVLKNQGLRDMIITARFNTETLNVW